MSSRRDLLALALAACAAGAACKGADRSATTGSAAGSATAGSATAGSAAVGSAVRPPDTQRPPGPPRISLDVPSMPLPHRESLALLDPGGGPRAVLRYAVAGEIEHRTALRLTTRARSAGPEAPGVALPEIRDGLRVAAAPSGGIALRALPAEVAAPSADAERYLAAWRTLLEGKELTARFDPTGQVGALTLRGGDDAAAQAELAQRLLIQIVPVPDEPVGVGARWRAVTILRHGLAYAKQTATYTLSARTATRWRVHAQITRVAERQAIADPSLPPGTAAELLALSRSLDGDLDVDPRRALVVGGALAIESRLHARLTPAGQPAIEQVLEDTGQVTFSVR